jgi:DNA/RNA-binding domain of Phe-tRNA-synthetase-like protein
VQLVVAPELGGIVRLGALVVEAVHNARGTDRLDAPLAEVESRVRLHPPEESQVVRAMYRRIGLDPTKTRPSSEALLRRVRKGDRLPRINTLVDICNWCSLEFQLPYGLYDVAALEPPVALRLGREGESYAGIRKDVVHVGGRMTLADARGPFGNPTSDSARSMVTEATTSVLTVVFAPAETSRARLDAVLTATAERIHQFAGGTEVVRIVI